MSEFDSQKFMGFTVGDLRAAFTAIQDKTNWKRHIIAKVPGIDFAKYNAAAIFFAGSPLKVTKTLSGGMVEVYGDGYYVCIGA